MEEAKAAAYYDELTRKGEGAARFKQGLGFSASSPGKTADFEKQAQLETIQNKLKKNPSRETLKSSRVSRDRRSSSRERDGDGRSRRRSRSRSRDGLGSRHRRRSSSRDRERDRYRDRERDRERRKRRRSRSRSRSDSGEGRRQRRERKRSRSGSRDRSGSPRDRMLEKSGGDRGKDRGVSKVGKERNGAVDYARLIEGYDKMTPAERVKAKMKLQLSETVEKDTVKGMGSGWERFEFDKDAPLDDEEIEVAEDDAVLVKHIGQSFRFSAVEAKREEQVKAAHDEAMFGAPTLPSSSNTGHEEQQDNNESKETVIATSFISDKVIARQQGSWRDRARKV
ncbi:hypothetical protein NMG60_11009546 [Bertholletia excelsa]